MCFKVVASAISPSGIVKVQTTFSDLLYPIKKALVMCLNFQPIRLGLGLVAGGSESQLGDRGGRILLLEGADTRNRKSASSDARSCMDQTAVWK